MGDRFGRLIELHEDQYDPTYGESGHSIFDVRTCRTCGALVDAAATEIHTAWHDATSRPEPF